MAPEFEAGIFDSRGRRGPGKQATDGGEVERVFRIAEQGRITLGFLNELDGVEAMPRKYAGKFEQRRHPQRAFSDEARSTRTTGRTEFANFFSTHHVTMLQFAAPGKRL
jgi:hypothetical protein